MISSVVINGIFNSEEPVELIVKDDLFILTGDNGSGKTTILNMIYYSLNGNFEWFFDKSFEKIKLKFIENQIGLIYLEVEQKNPESINATYMFENTSYEISVKRRSYLRDYRFNLKVEGSDDNQDGYLDNEDIIQNNRRTHRTRDPKGASVIDDLIVKHKSLRFIMDIRKSLLYFPTYRRIDSDIKGLIENSLDMNFKYIYSEFNSMDLKINNTSKDRRVIGVGNEDIQDLYKGYSESLRAFNSGGLNKLLTEFIKVVIESLYEEGNKKNELQLIEEAPRHLLELADKLGIKNIDRDKVFNHYSRIKKNREQLETYMENSEISINIKLKSQEKRISQELNRKNENDIVLMNAFNTLLFELKNEKTIVNELINLYKAHITEQEKMLRPYNFLKEGFQLFFENKLDIELDSNDYSLTLSKSFSNLSTGEMQLITILSYYGLALRESPLEPLVIIDEPELSLHISWQGKLLSHLMKKDHTKLLIATHSPFIAKTKYMKYLHQLGDIDGNF